MIPAGYEKHNQKYKFDFESDEDDDDDEFIFDFAQKKKETIPLEKEKLVALTNENCLNKSRSVQITDSQNTGLTYELNNNYYYDKMDYVLEDFKNAILHKNLELIVKLINEHNLDVNCIFKTNWTPLMYAASCGNFEITEFLLNKGADPLYCDDSYSVLLCACGCVDPSSNPIDLVKIVKLLICKGANVNSYDKYYQTPLMYASRTNNIVLIDVLYESHADLDAQDDNEWTSLAHASSKGNFKCVLKLLKLGADPTIYTNEYLYPFDLAQRRGYNDVKDLIKRFLRVKKQENLKNLNNDGKSIDLSLDDGFDSLEEEDDSLIYGQPNKNFKDEIETFLSALQLNNLLKYFKRSKTTMKLLLNYEDDDLKNIGISDAYARDLILNEIKKFHHRNWKSSSLTPIRQDFSINCNEAIAIVTNLARHTEYMTTNIKYIAMESKKSNCDLFADKFLSSKLLIELKETLKNSKELLNQVEKYCGIVENTVKETTNEPVDSIDNRDSHKWLSSPAKLMTMTAIGITGVGAAFFYLRKKFL